MKKTWLLVVAVGVWSGCGGSTDPLKSGVQVSFATRNPAASGAPSSRLTALASGAVIAGDTIRDGTNTLIVDKVEMVLRTIEFERVETNACGTPVAGCEKIELGPVLVDLPLGAGAQQRFAAQIPGGAYDEVKFEIHKVSKDDPAEAAFRQANPGFVDRSIRVQGLFNGQSFTYETDLNVQQELKLAPPLMVASGGTTVANVTIRVTLADWFRSSTGGLLSPSTANKGGPNESRVNSNIQNSMKAFEDRDRDGDERDG